MIPLFRSYQSTVTPFERGKSAFNFKIFQDPVTGAPTGLQTEAGNGPDGIWTPVDLTAAQIAAPDALMLADLNATYRLNEAPYTRYVSNGTTLIPALGGDAVLAADQTFTGTNTFTGSVHLGDGTGSPQENINGAAATLKGFNFQNASVNRWRLLMDASNNFALFAYDAAGGFLNTAFNAAQSTLSFSLNYRLLSAVSYAPTVGSFVNHLAATNTGTSPAYGHRFDYVSSAGDTGFDVGLGVICTFPIAFTGGVLPVKDAVYIVSESPNDTTHVWDTYIGELNTVNRGLDVGFKRSREDAGNNTGGFLFVPESIVLSGGPGEGKNVTFAYTVARSGSANSTGFPVKSYTGYLVEPNSIVGLTGRGSYMTGDITSTASQRPYGPLQTDGTWLHGIDHTLATYIDTYAETMLVGQGLAWIVGTTGTPTATATIAGSGSSTNASLTLTPAGTGAVNIVGVATNSSAAAGVVGEYLTNGSEQSVATVTITIATPGVVTWTAHGLQALTPVYFSTTSALPTGITAFTPYYLTVGFVGTDTFQISTTIANALAGTSVNTSGSQSGTQSGHGGIITGTGSPYDVIGLQLTAGDWDVQGAFSPFYANATSVTVFSAWLGTSGGSTKPTTAGTLLAAAGSSDEFAATVQPAKTMRTGMLRVSLAAAGMVVLSAQSTFTVANPALYGFLRARRVR